MFEALLASPDFEIAGIVSRHLSEKELNGVKVAKSIDELENIDVAIICAPSRVRSGIGRISSQKRYLHGRQL